MRKLSNHGDTIVEVMISLAVLGLVVAGAFSITNAALRNSRQAQERSEATKIAESQIEMIKALDTTPPAGTFCVNGSTVSTFSAPPADFWTDTYAAYHASCRGVGTGALYNVFVTRSNNDRYSVNVRWDRIGGGKEQVVLVYAGYER